MKIGELMHLDKNIQKVNFIINPQFIQYLTTEILSVIPRKVFTLENVVGKALIDAGNLTSKHSASCVASIRLRRSSSSDKAILHTGQHTFKPISEARDVGLIL